MAQLNDLLVMGQSTLLGPVTMDSVAMNGLSVTGQTTLSGPVTIDNTITANKFVGDGSGLENVSAVKPITKEAFDALAQGEGYQLNTLYCIIG